jgi:hypothetical protein
MFPMTWNIDGKEFTGNAPSEPENLRHAAAIALVGTPDHIVLTLTSRINLSLTHAGTGTITVEEGLRWARSDQGRAIIGIDEPAGFTTRIDQLAERVRFRR